MSDLKKWNVEDPEFWEKEGKSIARRNLWISIPSLLCGFAVWLYWGIITVQMLNLGFPFEKSELFYPDGHCRFNGGDVTNSQQLLYSPLWWPQYYFLYHGTVNASGSWCRYSPAGQKYTFMGISGAGAAIRFWRRQLCIVPCPISAFSSLKKEQGLALGLNAGLGNFGVTTMQILVPLVMTFGLFGAMGGDSMVLENTSGTLIGKIPAGSETWIQNAGFVWLLFLVPLAIAGWFGMNNIRTQEVSPDIGGPLSSFAIILAMLLVGFFTSTLGLWLLLPDSAGGSGFGVPKEIVLLLVIFSTVMLLKLFPGQIRTNLKRQYQIFNHRHTWVMSVIYTMTFGSFIGFSAAFALAIKVIFGYSHIEVDGVMTHDVVNPNGPSALMYAWMGAFIGALIRPFGGWMADKVGGALVTQVVSVVMALSALGVAYFMKAAYASATPEEYFVPFLLLFLVLFAATGIGNGSTFRTIAMIFPKEQAGPVLGWTSAVAAYGAFYIPKVFGEQIKATTPEYALYGFAAFYAVCILINWWFYLRPGAEYKNP